MELLGYPQLCQKLKGVLCQPTAGRFILLEGGCGLGKRLMAIELLRQWSAAEPIVSDPEGSRGHSIEQVRQLSLQIQQTGLGRARVGCVISDMHLLSPVCCHALLKTLEELPAHLLLIGTSSAPVISTVRSRALRVQVDPYSDQQLRSWLAVQALLPSSSAQVEELLLFAGGSPAQALLFCSAPFQKRLALFRQLAQATRYSDLADPLSQLERLELAPAQLLDEALHVIASTRPLKEWSHYRQWLEMVDSAKEMVNRSSKLSHALELLWLRLSSTRWGARPRLSSSERSSMIDL